MEKTLTATEVFDFFAHPHPFLVDRREIMLYNFSLLRRDLRMMIKYLRALDNPPASVASDALQCTLFEVLTTPVPFDDLVNNLKIIGEPADAATRWGNEFKKLYASALEFASLLVGNGNPMRDAIAKEITDLVQHKKRIKIYCYKNAPHYFKSLSDLLDESHFITSNAGYARSESFDVLIKVGSLRSRGWGRCPDALLTAPRFETIINFVWSGLRDEPGFGLDPVLSTLIIDDQSKGNFYLSLGGISWRQIYSRIGDTISEEQKDELALIDGNEFEQLNTFDAPKLRRAALVQVNETEGILVTAREELLFFSPERESHDQILLCPLVEIDTSDETFLIIPDIDDIDWSKPHARAGKYSQIWKACLSKEIKNDHTGFCNCLRDKGVNLLCLYHRLLEWEKPPDTVIPAPKKREHFRILIDLLNIDFEIRPLGQRLPWWMYAWNEISHSKGEAISEGRYGHQLEDEIILEQLHLLTNDIKIHSETKNRFSIPIPTTSNLVGQFSFYRIITVENGLLASDLACDRKIHNLREFERWRCE